MGYEIAEQLGWRLPDVIVYPAGGGVGIIGIYKALRELRDLGWVEGELPRLVAVQASGCAPIVAAFASGAAESQPWPDARTVAFGITVPKALGDFLVLDAVRETGGTAVAVDDDALLADQREIARLEGSLICPEGAACVTAVRQLRQSGWLAATTRWSCSTPAPGSSTRTWWPWAARARARRFAPGPVRNRCCTPSEQPGRNPARACVYGPVRGSWRPRAFGYRRLLPMTYGGSVALIVIGAILRFAISVLARERELAAHRGDPDDRGRHRPGRLPGVDVRAQASDHHDDQDPELDRGLRGASLHGAAALTGRAPGRLAPGTDHGPGGAWLSGSSHVPPPGLPGPCHACRVGSPRSP